MRWTVAWHPWRDLPPVGRMLRISVFMSVVVLVTTMWVAGGTETAAQRWPTTPDEIYRHPHPIKGRVHYFSDHDDQVYRLWKPALPISSLVMFAALFISQRYEVRLRDARRARSPQAMDETARPPES